MKNIYARGRKIPFENVVKNLRMGRYTRYIDDYANGGVAMFSEQKFADNLGVPIPYLFRVGLLENESQNGWSLTGVPDYKKLLKLKQTIINF